MAREYASHQLPELAKFLTEEYLRLVDMWLELGVPEVAAQERFDKATRHVKDMVLDLAEGEQQMRKRVLESIQEYELQVEDIRRRLCLPPFELEDTLSPLAREEILREEVDRLEHVKVERFRRHKQLRTEERQLCQRLAMPPHGSILRDQNIPSEEDLEEIQQHVSMLEKEQERRLSHLSSLRMQILELMKLMEATPETGSEREVICEDLEDIRLSQELLTQAKAYHTKLQEQRKMLQEKRSDVAGKLELYWERLDTPEDYRENFLRQHATLKKSDIKALDEELKRCEVLKREKLAEFVDRLKEELLSWYEKCGVPERGARLEGTGSLDYDEKQVESLENELHVMKSFHLQHEGLFTKVEKREMLWEKLKEFEKRARDPSRFNNRGGGLLREEKERKRLQKELPKLEEEIQAYIADVKMTESGDSLFHMWSDNFIAHMEMQWEEYKEEKENEKQQRHQKQQATPLTNRGMKRHASPTPLQSVHKVSRLASTVRSSPRPLNTPALAVKKSAPRRSKGKPQPTRCDRRAAPLSEQQRPSTSRRAVMPRGANTTLKKVPEISLTSVTSYKEFQDALNSTKRTAARSTLVPNKRPTEAQPSASMHLRERKAGPRQLIF